MDRLTKADVERLMASPSPDVRAELAVRIAGLWGDRDLSPNEAKLADEIIRAMLRDVDVSVRKALCEALKDDPKLPRDVAMKLANDIDDIAVPILNTSLVFAEADLIELVRARAEPVQIAIASRAQVTPPVCDALIETRNENVALSLMRNDGAMLDEVVGAKVIDFFSGAEMVMEAMAERREVPARLTERLVAIVAENMRRRLRKSGQMSDDQADELVAWSRERSLLDLISPQATDNELLDLSEQLMRRERLTARLMLRAVCCGKMRFFEAAIARLADLDLPAARALIQDTGPHGLRSLCAAIELPELVYDVARFAVRVGYTSPGVEAELRARFRQAIGAKFGEEIVSLDDEAMLRRLIDIRTDATPVQSGAPLRLVQG
ncbi:MAG: DUF2336 domain-containing protein [Alphaproteobacteria bacterium]